MCAALTSLWDTEDVGLRPVILLALRSVGRGGTGDMGQRVRDEILEIQQNNQCKVRQHGGISVIATSSRATQ